MRHRLKLTIGTLALASLALVSAASHAACPGTPTSYLPIKQIQFSGGGSTVTSYIEVDASSGAGADPCGCRTASNVLYLIRSEATITEAHKLFLALAMEAKALNKRISYNGLSCPSGASSGYVDYSQLTMEP